MQADTTNFEDELKVKEARGKNHWRFIQAVTWIDTEGFITFSFMNI